MKSVVINGFKPLEEMGAYGPSGGQCASASEDGINK